MLLVFFSLGAGSRADRVETRTTMAWAGWPKRGRCGSPASRCMFDFKLTIEKRTVGQQTFLIDLAEIARLKRQSRTLETTISGQTSWQTWHF